MIDAKRISLSFGERPLIADLSLRIARGDRVGIVGPNGAGKTTLLNLLLKRLAPDAGEVRHGAQLTIAHIDQDRAALDPTRTLLQTLAPLGGDQVVVNGRARHVAAYARDFLFSAGQLRQPVGALSGGERNRLALAATLARPANLLVLDEPTNDLDIDTLDALEDMLAGYEGTILLVSHDRSFLDGVATQIVGPIGQGRWAETPGGWADFEREHGSAFAPRRIAPAARAAPPPPPNRTPTKLSYKDERRAAELETLLPALHAEAQALEAAMSDPRLFAEDAAKFRSAAGRLEAVRAEIDRGENDWLEIEMRREQLQRKE